MKNVISNFFRLFVTNKGFVFAITFMPVILFLVMTVLLPYSEVHSITIINNTDDSAIEDAVRNIEGIAVQEIDEDDIAESSAGGVVEIAVIIDENPMDGKPAASVVSAGDSEIADAVALAASEAGANEDNSLTKVNSADKHSQKLITTAPFMLFKFLESGSFFGAMILMERKRKLKDRILLSGISPVSYYGGMTVVYLVLSMIGTLLYFVTAMVLGFDTGMRHPVHYLLMICLVNIISASVYFFACSFVNTESSLETAATYPLEILSFTSGLFFPYDYLPQVLREIGKFSPQRWITRGIESIQTSGTISAAAGDIILVVGFSIILYSAGLFRLIRKR